MLVEDDTLIQELYQMQLQKEGFEVVVYGDGTQAVEGLRGNTFDIVLLDVMLPGKDGLQILDEMRTMPEHANTKVVMLTNLGNEHVIEKTKQLGALGYIIKADYDPFQVIEKVKGYIAAPAPAQQQTVATPLAQT